MIEKTSHANGCMLAPPSSSYLVKSACTAHTLFNILFHRGPGVQPLNSFSGFLDTDHRMVSHASHTLHIASKHQHQESPTCHDVTTTDHACRCIDSAVFHSEMQGLCHKQQFSAFKISNRGSFLCAGVRGMLRCWQIRFSDCSSLLTLLRVTAATEPVTSVGKGSLNLKPLMDCSQQTVSCCLGPLQCTEAHLHTASDLFKNQQQPTLQLPLQDSSSKDRQYCSCLACVPCCVPANPGCAIWKTN